MNWKRYLPIIGIIIFIYILLKINLLNIFNEIKNANIFYLGIAVFWLIFVGLSIQTFKWYIIARKQKIEVPFLKAFKINLMTNFYGFITPSKVGTAMRAEYLRKYTENNIGKGMGNFVIDKALDLISLFIIAIIFSFILKDKLNLVYLDYYFFALGIILVSTFLVFYNKERSKSILRIFYRRFIPKNMHDKAKITFESFYEDLPKKRFLLLVLVINIVNWIFTYVLTYLVGLSLGINLSFDYYLAVLPLVTLITQIPITINGIGTREVSMIGLFGLFGIGATEVVSMSILSLFLFGVLPAIIGGFLILRNKD